MEARRCRASGYEFLSNVKIMGNELTCINPYDKDASQLILLFG